MPIALTINIIEITTSPINNSGNIFFFELRTTEVISRAMLAMSENREFASVSRSMIADVTMRRVINNIAEIFFLEDIFEYKYEENIIKSMLARVKRAPTSGIFGIYRMLFSTHISSLRTGCLKINDRRT